MGKPVLDHKVSTVMEDLAENFEIGAERAFVYKNEIWKFKIVGITEEGEPMFTIDIEERGDWHEM